MNFIGGEQLARFQRFQPDQAFFDRTAKFGLDLPVHIFALATHHEFSEEKFEFLAALYWASQKRHRAFAIEVIPLIEGRTTSALRSRDSWTKAVQVADFIDCQVADGVKQDAAVLDAEQTFAATRRDIFRYLKRVRAWRAEALNPEYADDELGFGDYIDGYSIAPDGRLVTKTDN